MKGELKSATRENLGLFVGTVLAHQRQPLSATSWDLLGCLVLLHAASLDRPVVRYGWTMWTAEQERCGWPTAPTVGGEWRTATMDRMLEWYAVVSKNFNLVVML